MKRFTAHFINGTKEFILPLCENCLASGDDCQKQCYSVAMCLLAAYEDTGLTPDEIMKLKEGNQMADVGFVEIEVLQAKNTKVLAINGTRVSREKGYGMMSVIAKFEVPISDIREIIDGATMDGDAE